MGLETGAFTSTPLPQYLVPAIPWIVFIFIWINPLPIWNKAGRKYWLRTTLKVIAAPFFFVRFSDFWLGDQFVSVIRIMYDFEYTLCFYSTSSFDTGSDYCQGTWNWTSNIIVLFTYWFRFAQCLRSSYSFHLSHNFKMKKIFIWNAGKYLSAMAVITVDLVAYLTVRFWNVPVFIVWVVLCTGSVIYFTYWDLVHDWGMFATDPKPEAPLLRAKLQYTRVWVYYLAMASNCILRLNWIVSVSPYMLSRFWGNGAIVMAISMGEIFRRGQWNIFQVEQEHLNNAYQYRAIRYVPIALTDKEDSVQGTMYNGSHRLMERLRAFFSRGRKQTPRFHPRTDYGGVDTNTATQADQYSGSQLESASQLAQGDIEMARTKTNPHESGIDASNSEDTDSDQRRIDSRHTNQGRTDMLSRLEAGFGSRSNNDERITCFLMVSVDVFYDNRTS
eukprot:GILJ01008966.1.p1 GENE.GILJ01008966.1~~GILJ01008966.1.p1  ORF type:complete len:483 (+),score=53.98 GILJ01008966.1:116-1450(+)